MTRNNEAPPGARFARLATRLLSGPIVLLALLGACAEETQPTGGTPVRRQEFPGPIECRICEGLEILEKSASRSAEALGAVADPGPVFEPEAEDPPPKPSHVVDLLVVHPFSDGLDERQTEDLEADIERVNLALRRGRTGVGIRLLGIEKVRGNLPAGSETPKRLAIQLADPEDEIMDGVHDQRSTADLVCLLCKSAGSPGAAYEYPDVNTGFLVVSVGRLMNRKMTLLHELGHAFGCGHGDKPSPGIARPHRIPGARDSYFTVMDDGRGLLGPCRLPVFSDPALKLVVGDEKLVLGKEGHADHAQVIRDNAADIAGLK